MRQDKTPDLLAKFQPEPWEPATRHENWLIFGGGGVLCVVILGLIGWLVYKALT